MLNIYQANQYGCIERNELRHNWTIHSNIFKYTDSHSLPICRNSLYHTVWLGFNYPVEDLYGRFSRSIQNIKISQNSWMCALSLIISLQNS